LTQKRELFADGHEFPVTGAYEKLVGKAYGEFDPGSPLNRVIVNIDKAPRNRRGKVEYAILQMNLSHVSTMSPAPRLPETDGLPFHRRA
jgi:hypothetical protein